MLQFLLRISILSYSTKLTVMHYSLILSSHFLMFYLLKPRKKGRKETFYSISPSRQPIEYTSFPIQSNKSIDLPAL